MISNPFRYVVVICLIASAHVASAQFYSNNSGATYTPDKVTIGASAATSARLEVTSTQQLIHLLLTGREYYTDGATDTAGVAVLLGVNRSANRQLWFVDSATAGQTNPRPSVLRFHLGGADPVIDAIDTAGSHKLLRIGGAGNLALVPDAGKLGIGTTTPLYLLDVNAASDNSTFPGTPISIRIADTRPHSTANAGSGIAFDAVYNQGAGQTTIGIISGVKETTVDGQYGGALTFGTRADASGGGSMERMRIRSTGEVVIGPATGTGQRLTVNGDVTVSGNIAAKYQDLAEWVPSAEDLAAGTVVVLDPTVPNQVMASTRSYDTTVAGVVSQQPGIILGEAGAAKEQVATTGRVKVRVDATAAPVRIGDLLVTSDTPGTAMKSQAVEVAGIAMHRPGTVIGKALEPLNGGVGEILVLLSMQ